MEVEVKKTASAGKALVQGLSSLTPPRLSTRRIISALLQHDTQADERLSPGYSGTHVVTSDCKSRVCLNRCFVGGAATTMVFVKHPTLSSAFWGFPTESCQRHLAHWRMEDPAIAKAFSRLAMQSSTMNGHGRYLLPVRHRDVSNEFVVTGRGSFLEILPRDSAVQKRTSFNTRPIGCAEILDLKEGQMQKLNRYQELLFSPDNEFSYLGNNQVLCSDGMSRVFLTSWHLRDTSYVLFAPPVFEQALWIIPIKTFQQFLRRADGLDDSGYLVEDILSRTLGTRKLDANNRIRFEGLDLYTRSGAYRITGVGPYLEAVPEPLADRYESLMDSLDSSGIAGNK